MANTQFWMTVAASVIASVVSGLLLYGVTRSYLERIVSQNEAERQYLEQLARQYRGYV